MKYYLIAGEPSGDLHGANLMRGLLKSDPCAEFRFWGGDKMTAVGGADALAKHYREASFMGISEVVKNLDKIGRQLVECKKDILDYNPDVVILIDYPGFNFRIAKFAKLHNIKTFYYISPKVWAWKESRVKKIKKYVDQLFIIFPFEVEYFQKRGINAFYAGNPLMDSLAAERERFIHDTEFRTQNGLDERPVVALLAGSRSAEVNGNLEYMCEIATHFPAYQFVVAGVEWLDKSIYNNHLKGDNVKIVYDQTYQLLSGATAAVVTSGTATLETALLGVPEMICYRSGWLMWFMGKKVFRIKYVCLVNIILNRLSVCEMLRDDMRIDMGIEQLTAILPGGDKRAKMLEDYAELRAVIGDSGASDRFAAEMVRLIKTK